MLDNTVNISSKVSHAQNQQLGFERDSNLIKCFRVISPYFGFHWHYHQEFEITMVLKGRGIRMVGDHLDYFESNDFVLLGSNLPHTWISDDDYKSSDEQMEVFVLQFHPELISDRWVNWNEAEKLRTLISRSNRGISYAGLMSDQFKTLMYQIEGSTGLQTVILTLELLSRLTQMEGKLLSSTSYTPSLKHSTEDRLRTVCQYMHDHFTSPVKLDELAGLVNMNPSAFSRFFKKATGQSPSEYILDLRIGKACNLILESQQLNMTEIAFRSGFNSQTLFNRAFLKKKKMTPSQFRKIKMASM